MLLTEEVEPKECRMPVVTFSLELDLINGPKTLVAVFLMMDAALKDDLKVSL